MIPYGRQNINDADIAAVVEVLRSDYLTQGPVVPAFESAVAARCGATYGVAVNSATSALHIACLALGVGSGDMVWTSPISFVASSNCARYCGADVDFVDIDPRTYNMSVESLAEKLSIAKQHGRLPKVVIPVHLAGQSCDMAAISKLSEIYGFKVIEDASHAIGGSFKGDAVGCGRYSAITVFSFHPVKIITSGEGGMAVTNDPELAKKMASLRSHGITRYPSEMTCSPDGAWYYQQLELGFNYRMTELQAALGMSQLSRLDDFVRRRHEIARRYEDLLSGSEVTLPWQSPDVYSAMHLFIVRVSSADHSIIFERMRSAGIGVNLHYIPIYRHPYYSKIGYSSGDFPQAEAYYSEAISIPMYPDLSDSQQDEVVRHLISPSGYQTIF